MKKIIIPFIAIAAFAFTKDSDNGLTFKIQYSPNTEYNEDIAMSTNSVIKYSGSAEFMKRLKDKGMHSPMKKKSNSDMQITFKTGAFLPDGKHFPVSINFKSCKSGGSKVAIATGTIISGRGTQDSVPKLDSIYSPEMGEETRATLLKTMQSMFSQVTFPEKKLNIGDTFSHAMPMAIPMGGSNLNMSINTTYKLMRIKDGIAYFDIKQVYTMNSSQYTLSGGGSGEGKIEYDIARHFYRYYAESCTFSGKMQMGEVGIDMTSTSNLVQKNTFVSN